MTGVILVLLVASIVLTGISWIWVIEIGKNKKLEAENVRLKEELLEKEQNAEMARLESQVAEDSKNLDGSKATLDALISDNTAK